MKCRSFEQVIKFMDLSELCQTNWTFFHKRKKFFYRKPELRNEKKKYLVCRFYLILCIKRKKENMK